MTVFDLKKGDTAIVKKVNIEGSAAARLAALGLKNDTCIKILSFSLFKSAALLNFGAVRLGIRRPMAEKIEVEIISEGAQK